MQKILILGAGVYQVPLIRKAKELGYYVVVMSIRGNYPGFAYADKVYYVDTTDKVQALKIAQAENVSAVCTTGTDVCVPTIGWICDELKLPGITYDTAMKASNKWLMKQALLQHGVCTPNGYKVACIEEAVECFEKLNKNAVLKVVDKSGSRGIVHVQTEDELKLAYKECMAITGENYLLIEEYIAGREIGVSGIIQKGKIRCILAHKKIMTQNDGVSIQVGHIFNQSINQSCAATIRALCIDNTAFNFDIIIHDENAYILEVAARCGATGIPECMGIMYETDYFKCIIENAMGKDVGTFEIGDIYAASLLFFSKQGGVLKSIDYPQIGAISFDYNIGDIIPKFENATNRIGQAIISASSRSEIDYKLRLLEDVRIMVAS